MNEAMSEVTEPDYGGDIDQVFGAYASQLREKVQADNPELSPEQAEQRLWHIIPEATAFMEPVESEDIFNQAVSMLDAYPA